VAEHFHRHMQRAVDAGRRVRNPAGSLLGVGHEIFHALPRVIRADSENRRIGGKERQRHELIDRVGRLAVKEFVRLGNDRDARECHQQRIAVGLAVGDEGHADRPAAPVLFTTTTGFLRIFSIDAATGRAVRSATPPGGKGATIVIGRSGNFS
jgi:hypothetical protein